MGTVGQGYRESGGVPGAGACSATSRQETVSSVSRSSTLSSWKGNSGTISHPDGLRQALRTAVTLPPGFISVSTAPRRSSSTMTSRSSGSWVEKDTCFSLSPSTWRAYRP